MITPSQLSQEDFISSFGSVYEHAPWIAKQLFAQGVDNSTHIKNSMKEILNNAGKDAGLIGQPARMVGLTQLLDYILSFPDIWCCRRINIANHWIENHSP